MTKSNAHHLNFSAVYFVVVAFTVSQSFPNIWYSVYLEEYDYFFRKTNQSVYQGTGS